MLSRVHLLLLLAAATAVSAVQKLSDKDGKCKDKKNTVYCYSNARGGFTKNSVSLWARGQEAALVTRRS